MVRRRTQNNIFLPQEKIREMALDLVLYEQDSQDEKWGNQSHKSNITRLCVLAEEVGELARECIEGGLPEKLETELTHVTAVALAWLEDLQRKK